jgi:uncharacterized protein (TIGR00266 family)
MQFAVKHQPAYSLAVAMLDPGEVVHAECGAMVGMSAGVTLDTGAQGGLLQSLARTAMGQSFFLNTFRAPSGGGEVLLAPALPGDIRALTLCRDESLLMCPGSYLASSAGIAFEVGWGGVGTAVAGQGFFLLRVSGPGILVLSSYGAIQEIDLNQGDGYTIDTGHLVGFSDGMGFKVRPAGSVKATLFSGEGLVIDLAGPGRILLQTRNEAALLAWLAAKLRGVKQSNGGEHGG